ncbi:MAG: hypothetical protein WCK98_05775 [bacterium]
MIRINAKDRYLDLSHSFKIYYVIAIGIFISVLTFFAYQNLITTLTMAACTIVAYVLLSQPPQKIQVSIVDPGIIFDDEQVPWENCICWAMIDLGNTLEFIVQTSSITKDFYYFYLPDNAPEVKDIVNNLSQFLPYNEQIINVNRVHNFLRNWGLK